DVPSEVLKQLVDGGRIAATTDFGAVADADAVVIAVPTPLSPQREPDVSYIRRAARDIAPHLRKGHLVVLESTTYPGTTRDVLRPLLEEGSGLEAGDGFHLAYAPERVDPGRTDYTTKTTPKVVGGVDEASTEAAAELYSAAVDEVVRVSSPEAAATKPFGFMSFKPGPGLGGHCIPIDPFYLTWKAREYDFTTEFIELAG